MNRKEIGILVGLGALLIVLILLIALNRPAEQAPSSPGLIGREEAPDLPPPQISSEALRAEPPIGIRVPGVNEIITETQKEVVAVPTVVTPAAPGVSAQYRRFEIRAENGRFSPYQIIANVGDTVRIEFTAIDRDYDIVFQGNNMSAAAKQGETKVLEFQALMDGDFLYYCRSCGGPEGETKGNIIIVK